MLQTVGFASDCRPTLPTSEELFFSHTFYCHTPASQVQRSRRRTEPAVANVPRFKQVGSLPLRMHGDLQNLTFRPLGLIRLPKKITTFIDFLKESFLIDELSGPREISITWYVSFLENFLKIKTKRSTLLRVPDEIPRDRNDGFSKTKGRSGKDCS